MELGGVGIGSGGEGGRSVGWSGVECLHIVWNCMA